MFLKIHETLCYSKIRLYKAWKNNFKKFFHTKCGCSRWSSLSFPEPKHAIGLLVPARVMVLHGKYRLKSEDVMTYLGEYNFTMNTSLDLYQLECAWMPNVMVALPNIGGALCSTPQSLADAHCGVPCSNAAVACEHHLTSRDTHLLCAGGETVWHERCRFALLWFNWDFESCYSLVSA